MQIQFLAKKSKISHIRSLLCVRISVDSGMYPLMEKLRPRFFIKNHAKKNFVGPFPIILSDLRDPRTFSLEFPRILSQSFSNEEKDFFIIPKYLGTFFDFEWINRLRDKSVSCFQLFEFEIMFDFDEIVDLAQIIE